MVSLRERLGEDEPQFPCKLAGDVRRVIDSGDDVAHKVAELGEAISVDDLVARSGSRILVVSASRRASSSLRPVIR